MNLPMEFLIYCIEEYKFSHQLSGREAFETFVRKGVDQYILRHYDALHTAGIQYTMEDIQQLLQ